MKDTVIEIFKALPKTNCGECGLPTCLAFARKLETYEVPVDNCPYVAAVCPKCGHSEERIFRHCPGCGADVSEVRMSMEKEATVCPKCGYGSKEPFGECPNCGVEVAVHSRQARKAEATAKVQAQVAPVSPEHPPENPPAPAQPAMRRPDPDVTLRAPLERKPQARPDRTPKSVADLTSAPDSSMDTEAYFKKKDSPPRHCPYCGFTTQEELAECPRCGQTGEWDIVGR